MKHFKNPVSMRVTQEQFENDLKKPLEELGAKFECISCFKKYPILVSNSSNRNGVIENFLEHNKSDNNRHFIEIYDPEQFIAICKLEVEMIVGECYTVSADCLDSKLTGYILENNVGNNKDGLWGYFKGVGYLGYYFEKSHINYFSETYTIRLSTPEEKAKLDRVIAKNKKEDVFVTKMPQLTMEEKMNTFKEDIEEFVSSHQETILKIDSVIREHKEEIRKLKYAKKIIQTLR